MSQTGSSLLALSGNMNFIDMRDLLLYGIHESAHNNSMNAPTQKTPPARLSSLATAVPRHAIDQGDVEAFGRRLFGTARRSSSVSPAPI